MKSTNDVKTFYRSATADTNPARDEAILADALQAGGLTTKKRTARAEPSVWRAIMKSRTTHLATAAVIVIAVVVSLTCFNEPTVQAVELSEISEAMSAVPWMHAWALADGHDVAGAIELWVGFDAWVRAGKMPDGAMSFCRFKAHEIAEYDPDSNTVTLSYVQEDEFFPQASSPVHMLEAMRRMLEQHDAEIVARRGDHQGRKVLIQDISLAGMGKGIDRYALRLYIDPQSKLLYGAEATASDANGVTVSTARIEYDYPSTGPQDIYELGVPRSARVVDHLAGEESPARLEREQPQPLPEPNDVGDRDSLRGQSQADEVGPETVASTVSEKTMLVRVVEKVTGAPLANADIRTYINGSRQYKADRNGTYRLRLGGATPEYMNLFARKPGYVGQSIRFDGTAGMELPSEFVFELEKGTIIGGVVQDTEGQPVAGATVSFSINDDQGQNELGMDVRYEGTTNGQGRWTCTTVPADLAEVYLRVKHPDLAEGRFSVPGEIGLEALRARTAVMVIDQGVSCYGTVVDTEGRPIAGAKLLFGESRYTDDPEDRTATDEEGYFEFANMQPLNRSFLVTVEKTGCAPAMREVFVNEVDEAIAFVLEPGHRIAGRVVDVEGQPVEGARVHADRWRGYQNLEWRAETDASGRFVWEGAPDDEVDIGVYKSGYMQLTDAKLMPSEIDHELVLVPPIHVSGKVIDAATGRAIDRFKVVPRIGDTWQDSSSWISVQQDGRYEYRFTSQSPSYQWRIEAEDFMPAESRPIANDEQDVVFDFELVRAEGPSGSVVAADGTPVAGAEVYRKTGFFYMDDNIVTSKRKRQQRGTLVRTDDEGRFQFAPQEGECPLIVVAEQGFAYVTAEAFALDNTIVLEPYGRIEGDFYIGTQPGANRTIRVHYMDGVNLHLAYSVTTDAEGRFVFGKVIPGRVRVERDAIDLAPGATVEIHLGGVGRTVRGRLISPPGMTSVENMGLANITIDLIMPSIPSEEIPRPEGLEAMSYAEAQKWLYDYVQSETGRLRYEELARRYQRDRKHSLATMEDDGAFFVDNIEPGRYLMHGRVYERRADGRMNHETVVARVAYEFVVPEFEFPEQMDAPLHLGDICVLAGQLQVGDTAPEFAVSSLTGSDSIELDAYRGKFLLLNFYNAYILTKERERLQGIQQVRSEFGSRGDLAIVGIYLESTGVGYLAEKLLQECDLSGPHGTAGQYDSKIVVDYSVENLPYSVLIGPAGEVLAKGLKGQDLVRAVREVLSH